MKNNQLVTVLVDLRWYLAGSLSKKLKTISAIHHQPDPAKALGIISDVRSKVDVIVINPQTYQNSDLAIKACDEFKKLDNNLVLIILDPTENIISRPPEEINCDFIVSNSEKVAETIKALHKNLAAA